MGKMLERWDMERGVLEIVDAESLVAGILHFGNILFIHGRLVGKAGFDGSAAVFGNRRI